LLIGNPQSGIIFGVNNTTAIIGIKDEYKKSDPKN
jgi:hypothetical protein